MTKSGISKLFFIILIFIYLTDQLICLNKSVFKKISSKITLVWGRGCLYKQCFFVVLFNFFFFFGSEDELSNQPASFSSLFSLPKPNLSIVELFIPKYTKKNLQQILKTVLEAWAPIIFKESQDRPLKAWSLDIYYDQSYIE